MDALHLLLKEPRPFADAQGDRVGTVIFKGGVESSVYSFLQREQDG